jgi:hypothetical protein
MMALFLQGCQHQSKGNEPRFWYSVTTLYWNDRMSFSFSHTAVFVNLFFSRSSSRNGSTLSSPTAGSLFLVSIFLFVGLWIR